MEYLANVIDSLLFATFIVGWKIEKSKIVRKIRPILLMALLMFLNIYLSDEGNWSFSIAVIFDFFIIVFIGKRLLDYTLRDSITAFIVLYLVGFASVLAASLLLEFLTQNGWESWTNIQSEGRGYYLLTSKIILTVGLYLANKVYREMFIWKRVIYLWSYGMVPIVTFSICLGEIQKLFHKKTSKEMFTDNIYDYLVPLVLLATIIFLTIYVSHLEVKQKEHELLKERIRWEQKRYKELLEYERKVNKQRHDWKNKMLVISYLLEEGKIVESRKQIEESVKEIYAVHFDLTVGQKVWNIIIDNKLSERENQEIHFTKEIHLENLGIIAEVDFGIVLGNLLDNALEALELCEEKVLEVTLLQDKGFLYLEIVNNYSEELRENRHEKNKIEHGYGIINVKEIIHKCRGRYEVKKEAGLYAVKVLLPCE